MKNNSLPVKPASTSTATNVASTSKPTSQAKSKNNFEDGDNELVTTTYTVVPLDGGWGWIVVMAAFILNFVADGILYSFGDIYLDILSKEFDTSKKAVSLVPSLLLAFQHISGPFVSALINRYGFRKIAFLGGMISSIGFGVSYFALSVEFLCVSFGVMGGIGSSMMYVVAVISVSFYFQRWRALATCIAICGSSFGGMIVVQFLKPFVEHFKWRNSMLFLSAIMVFCAVLSLLFRKITPFQIARELTQDTENIISNYRLQGTTDVSAISDLNQRSTKVGFLGPNNRDFPTAAELVLTDGGSIAGIIPGTYSRRVSIVPPTPAALSTLDMINPLWDDRRDSTASYRILVGLDNNVQSQRREIQNTRCDFCRRLWCFNRKSNSGKVFRPLYRDDIFYQASLNRVPQYTSQMGSVGYNMAVSRIQTRNDIQEETKCIICPESVKRILATMLDMSLFRSPSFFLLTLNCCFMQLGMLVPFVYLPDRARTIGTDEASIGMFITSTMIVSTVSRIALGILTSFQWADLVIVNYVLMTVGAISMIVLGFASSVALQTTCCAFYGSALAAFYSLRSTIIVKVLGLEKLTNAFGLLLMFDGICAMVGPLFAGWIKDLTNNYDSVFIYSGVMILIAAASTYPLNCINRWEKQET